MSQRHTPDLVVAGSLVGLTTSALLADHGVPHLLVESHAEHLFGTDLVSFTQNSDRVVSVIRPRGGGPEQTITSDYLVAADGAHSSIREQLGIDMVGHGTFAECITMYFKADVRDLIEDRNLSLAIEVETI